MLMQCEDKTEEIFDFDGELTCWRQKVEVANRAYEGKRYSQAEILYADCLNQAEQWPKGLHHSDGRELSSALSKSLNNLGAVYHVQGKYTMAEEIYERSLQLKQELFGENSVDYALCLQNLAACYSAKGRYEEAEHMFSRSLKIREGILGENSPELVTTLKNFALLLKKLGKLLESMAMEVRASKIETACCKN